MLKHFRRDAEKYYEEVFAINLKVKKFGNLDITHTRILLGELTNSILILFNFLIM